MKAASDALKAFLNAARAGDASFVMADCYTITLSNGVIVRFTTWDWDVVYGGNTFAANAVLISGLKFKASVGLEVDRQQIVIAAWPGATVNGAPWMMALRDGTFDGAWFQRDRVFISGALPGGIDGVTLFKGRVATVDQVGRTSAQLTIASPLVVLDYDMPRNVYSPTCVHKLYDAGCGLSAAAHLTGSTVAAGSTRTVILTSLAAASHAQGSFVMSSGVNAGVRGTVKSAVAGVSLTLMFPLPLAPAEGDSFGVWTGCDHTAGTCVSRFSNGANFRGFPTIPPPTFAF